MRITLDLPDALEHELAAEAARLGVSLEQHVVGLLSRGRRRGSRLQTGAEVVDYWRREGLIGYRSDIRAGALHARRLRREAERRPRS